MIIERFLQLAILEVAAIVVVSRNNAGCSNHFHLEKHGDSVVTKFFCFLRDLSLVFKILLLPFLPPEEAKVCLANRKIGQIC